MDRYFFLFLAVFSLTVGIILHRGVAFIDATQTYNETRLKQALVPIYDFSKHEKNDTELIFVGDIMLGRGVESQINKAGGDFRYPFLKIADAIESADLAFANLEGPISSRGKNQGSQYSFRFKPEAVSGLTFAGFDVLSIANNHIWDWGKDAIADTISFLNANNIVAVGAGTNYENANEAKVVTIGDTRFAFLAYATLLPKSLNATDEKPGLSEFNIEKAKSDVNLAKSSADIIVVSFHWGEEYQVNANQHQKDIAHSLIDAGADLIVGHHPHVVQELERYTSTSLSASTAPASASASARQGWIAYSLGNFVFDQDFSKETKRGALLRVDVKNKKILDVKLEEVRISDTFQPSI